MMTADQVSDVRAPLRSNAPTRLVTSLPELLEFRAPYLEDKLLRLGLAESKPEAAQLLQEVTKYLLLADLHPERSVPMFSTRLDEVWHQFILFTSEYQSFCSRFAGRFLHHAPDEAPRSEPKPPLDFAEFRAIYEGLFGIFSPIWRDELWLTATTRLVWSTGVAKPLHVCVEGDKAMLIQNGEPSLLCRTDSRAEGALRFMASERCFLIRELPGLRDHDERIALCKPLVQFRILRVAP